MAKRRRRGLGSSALEHSGEVMRLAARFDGKAADVDKALRDGSCLAAVAGIVSLAELYGRLEVNAAGAPSSATTSVLKRTRATRDRLLTQSVACVRR